MPQRDHLPWSNVCKVASLRQPRQDEMIAEQSALPGILEGMGFGEATIRASSKFRMRPRTVDGAPVEGARVKISLVWNLG